MMYNLGIGEYDSAEKFGIKADELSRRYNNKSLYCFANNILASLYIEMNQPDKALVRLRIAEELKLDGEVISWEAYGIEINIAEAYIVDYIKEYSEIDDRRKKILLKINKLCRKL